MAYDNSCTIVGNMTRSPDLRYTGNGGAVVSFGVAVSEGKDKPAGFYDVTCFGQLAEHVAESADRGTRVVVFGRLNYQSWEDKNGGGKRSKVEIVADDVALSLKWNTGRANRPERQDGEQHHAAQQPTRGYGQARDLDEEPF
jgi:single-strand DNA-binding protein